MDVTAFSPAARHTDPVSSHLAAQDITASGIRGRHMALIVEAVRKHPGKTSAELAPLTGLERHEAARRTSDAESSHLIVKGAARKCSISGRLAVTWLPIDLSAVIAA